MSSLEERREIRRAWLFIAFMFWIPGAYIAMCLFTDLRIDKLRPFVNQAAIKIGVYEGISAYRKELAIDEEELIKMRRGRDQKIKKYLQRLEDMMDVENPKPQKPFFPPPGIPFWKWKSDDHRN